MGTALFGLVIGAVALYVVLLATVAVVSVRPPRIPLFLTPGILGEPEEPVSFETSDGVVLRGWWVKGPTETVLVYFHGYLANRSEWLPFASRLRRMGAAQLFVDHRCHGTSDRAKCTFGLDEARDVVAAVRYARERAPGAKIVLLGSSMGGAAAARALAADPSLADALVLDGPYANLDEAAKGFWYVTNLRPLAKALAPATLFGRVLLGFSPRETDMRPVYRGLQGQSALFLFGATDTVVPKESALACVEAAEADSVWFENSGHAQGRFHEPERYFDSIVGFLRREGLLRGPTGETDSLTTSIISQHNSV